MIIALKGAISVLAVIFYFISGASAQTDLNNSINGYDLSNQSYDIKVALDHIFISMKNNSFEISEIVVFRNEGPEINYSKDNHTFFAISTPPDARNLKTQAMECCLIQEEGVVYMDPMQPIAQGSNFEMQISYTLLPQGSEYAFNKSAVYNTTSLLMLIDKKSGMSIQGSDEILTLAGNEYNVIAFDNLKAGETVGIPIRITREPDYLYAGIGILFLISIGMVYHFKGRIFRKREEYTLEDLELEKKKIFQAIRGFEKHAGTEKSEEYMRLMDEYRYKVIRIFIKIDGLKKKGEINDKYSDRGAGTNTSLPP